MLLTYRSQSPPFILPSHPNAICVPSGENVGEATLPSKVVSGRKIGCFTEPASCERAIVFIASPRAFVGDQRYHPAPPSAVTATTAATAQRFHRRTPGSPLTISRSAPISVAD